MKKTYTNPTMEIINFDAEDIITTSGNTTDRFDENGNPIVE